MTKIVYVPYGIANRFSDRIELNEHLPEYPELHDQLLQHEQEHTDIEGFTKEDFLLDLGPTKVNYWKLIKFMVKYPKTFFQFFPIYKKGKDWIYDINLCIVYSVFIAVVGISVFLATK